MGNISKKIENFLKDFNKLKNLIFYCATLEIKSKGVKVKGKGEELKRVSRTWREFKAQKLSSEKGKYVKVLRVQQLRFRLKWIFRLVKADTRCSMRIWNQQSGHQRRWIRGCCT